ncbi:hypothetical protein [Solirubrum puertoriconensis]|uniref:Uncharacterized protein n=1 Tax=Solirubrum puertoriconensis TaxID=1751427 RepID=A0A9X0HHC5_SOLP1|nr:hypothetical protein [Solirubrum puertoriconensis]KUG05867.1 hypothetical protein ASU33_00305 [Solirubrum puertoriconensis]
MTSYVTRGFLDLAYRPDLHIVVGRWLRQINLEELKQGYLDMLELAAAHQCPYWLLDARRRVDTDKDATGWMLSYFAPQLPLRLGGQRSYLAYLVAPTHLRDVASDANFPPVSYFQDKPYMSSRFTDEAQAVEWLLSCQQAPATKHT